LFSKLDFGLQNENLVFKMGFLDYKWEVRVTIHRY
jgi:hypothetical protein